VRYAWIDPDRPGELTGAHPLWSHRWPAPVRFRRADYATTPDGSLSAFARDAAHAALGWRPAGPVRMLTQLRRWGWLFNPITIYVLWDDTGDDPAALVMEVTNTPWKERHVYATALTAIDGTLTARFPKQLHVSPFLDEDYEYAVDLCIRQDSIECSIDVVDADGSVRLATMLAVDRQPVSRRTLGRTLWSSPLSTHRVSFGIHRQAWRLWRRRVAVVPHPRKRSTVL
jgi:DUF1365 family protein